MSSEKKVFPDFKVYAPRDLRKEWHVEWRTPAGKRMKRRTGINQHSTYEDRMQAAEQLIETIKAHLEPDQSPAEQRAREWLDYFRHTVRKKTYYSYRGKIDDLFGYLHGQAPTRSLIETYFREKRKTLHPTTYNKYREQLRRVFREIGEEQLFGNIEPLKARSTPDLYFQRPQVQRLKRVISERDPVLWLFVQFVYYTFIRPNSELRLLQVSHLMLDDQKIYIPGHISKNERSQYVAIPDAFLPQLQHYWQEMPGAFLFPSTVRDDQPISYNVMYNRHRKILQELRFPKGYTLYSWKHTGAVHAAQAGVSLKDLQVQMRHHSLDQTDQYLRQMGVQQMTTIGRFPAI